MTLEEFDKQLEKFEKDFPEAKKKVVRENGKLLHEKVLENTRRDVGVKTGNLLKSIELHYGSKGGYAAVRGNHHVAPHLHLIEHGHWMRSGKRPSKKERDTRPVHGWVNGKHMFANALSDLADELEGNAQKMMDKLVGDTFG